MVCKEGGEGMSSQETKEVTKRSQTIALGLGKGSMLRIHWRCFLNGEQAFAREPGRSGKAVSIKGVFQSESVSWRKSAKTFFHF